MASRILSNLTLPCLLTSDELHALLGQPHPPCPTCGSAIYGVTHYGEFVCLGCEWDRAQDPAVCPMKVVLEVVNGVPIVREWGKAMAEIKEERRISEERKRLWEDYPIGEGGI
jgi:hypothetical protein